MQKKSWIGLLGGLSVAGVAIGYFTTKRGQEHADRIASQARDLRDRAVSRAEQLRRRAAEATEQVHGQSVDVAETGPADLNTVDRERLLALPGVDEMLADRIIENRPYRNKLDLVSRMVVPQETYDAMKDQVEIHDPEETVKVA